MPSSGAPLRSPFAVALAGLLGLASAMGIGRFAFTPLMPLMQQHDGLTLAQGAWLAAANYLGYLAGAVACWWRPPAPRPAIAGGLLAVAATTAAMALGHAFGHGEGLRLALRFAAGTASAFVLVAVAGWALEALAAMGRADLAGWVFAGVGFGVTTAGLVGLVAGHAALAPDTAWLLLGAAALAVALAGWRSWGRRADGRADEGPPQGAHEHAARRPPQRTRERPPEAMAPEAMQAAKPAGARAATPPATPQRQAARFGAAGWALVVAYGGFGFGYILPATFLPAMARARVPEPHLFGLAWPVFGLAAAASTVAVTRWFRAALPRTLFIGGALVMAVGVLLPVLRPTLGSIVAAALCVGGTFMVLTMSGLQEARRIAPPGAAPALTAAMTTAFALGQLLGPLVVGLLSAPARVAAAAGGPDVAAASWAAAAALVASVLVLAAGPAPRR
ncbi:MAG: YbfB/YjiJ family MFS transporter [Rubrivivax sp.]|nr:YbfB/YjiJ family MFS transporter [Rubrivivax sp.]